MLSKEDVREERISLEHRLLEIQKGLNKVQKDTSILRMKSSIALGQMRLEAESIREDKQFLADKCFHLRKKIKVSERFLETKNTELAMRQSMVQEAQEA